jgi:hypothetical protein
MQDMWYYYCYTASISDQITCQSSVYVKNHLIIICSFYRFLENTEEIAKLRQCFAGLWSLDDEDVVKSAIGNPDLFVLKPQREGGG